MINHPFEPIFLRSSQTLILGSFPSVKSRQQNFYYAHPQNRFWKLIAKICKTNIPNNIEEKKELILNNKLAIWDVIKSCEIEGSADSSIQNIEVSDINELINKTNITKVVFNGNKAADSYFKYNKRLENIEYVTLPSTSPANAQYSFERLYNIWKNEIIINSKEE